MKSLKKITLLFLSALLFACSASQPSKKIEDSSEWNSVQDPMSGLKTHVANLIESGSVAAYGEGRSYRRDLAYEKAKSNALGSLAEIFEQKVQRLRKNFQEEVGQDRESEINEMFTQVTKTTTNKVLTGAHPVKDNLMQNDEGEYLSGVVMAITPKSVNTSIIDAMQKGSPELYQRFRASQGFEELEKEMENYEN
ncbi:MAG: hypothetical protein K9N07_10585 [Candidatus Cloacimonetes bacterium]|nr:hypothetical protein [Candidatus Cloacimonadota bacterium]MCF8262294.1 hypothetical protein [Melioribacteraceae bacterium]